MHFLVFHPLAEMSYKNSKRNLLTEKLNLNEFCHIQALGAVALLFCSLLRIAIFAESGFEPWSAHCFWEAASHSRSLAQKLMGTAYYADQHWVQYGVLPAVLPCLISKSLPMSRNVVLKILCPTLLLLLVYEEQRQEKNKQCVLSYRATSSRFKNIEY